ncbi:hypothetical protein LENED_006804 [Lentinula edodes]|uniref:Uncharacterized protein n=1 Tax=Lentinula edodes TaxID=5353 RepID=A0A1Q3ECP0_LENED|nr:hypothetical protein LENED_006804 [Lentinula edodes]
MHPDHSNLPFNHESYLSASCIVDPQDFLSLLFNLGLFVEPPDDDHCLQAVHVVELGNKGSEPVYLLTCNSTVLSIKVFISGEYRHGLTTNLGA